MDLISPSQKKRQLPEEGDEVEESISLEGNLKESSESEAAMEDKPTRTGLFSRMLATSKAVFTQHHGITPLKTKSDKDNDKISTPKALFGQSLLSPKEVSKERRAEAQIDNGGVNVNQRSRRTVSYEDDLRNVEDGHMDATAIASPVQESLGKRVTDSFGETCSNHGEEEWTSLDTKKDEDCKEAENEGEQTVTIFDMEWKINETRTSSPVLAYPIIYTSNATGQMQWSNTLLYMTLPSCCDKNLSRLVNPFDLFFSSLYVD